MRHAYDNRLYTFIEEPNPRRRMFRYNRRMWKKHGPENLRALCLDGYRAGEVYDIRQDRGLGYAARVYVVSDDRWPWSLTGTNYVFVRKGENYGKCLWEAGARRVDIVRKALRKVLDDDMYVIRGYDENGRWTIL